MPSTGLLTHMGAKWMYNLMETSENAENSELGVVFKTVIRDFLEATLSPWSACLRFLASCWACGAIKGLFFVRAPIIFFFFLKRTASVTVFSLRHRLFRGHEHVGSPFTFTAVLLSWMSPMNRRQYLSRRWKNDGKNKNRLFLQKVLRIHLVSRHWTHLRKAPPVSRWVPSPRAPLHPSQKHHLDQHQKTSMNLSTRRHFQMLEDRFL